MKEYLSLSYMDLVLNTDHEVENTHYYILHHFVLNSSNLTTKLRVVFYASGKTCTGISLNDTLKVSPKSQYDLISILLRFRFLNIEITVYKRMLYRQVKILDKDRDFQRIFWKDSPDKQIQAFRLNHVWYGTPVVLNLATKSVTN